MKWILLLSSLVAWLAHPYLTVFNNAGVVLTQTATTGAHITLTSRGQHVIRIISPFPEPVWSARFRKL